MSDLYKIVTPENREFLERKLLRNSFVIPGGCRIWLGKPNTYGYGRMWVDGRRPFYTHQIAFELWNGPITEETIDHLCSNRLCFEFSHLDQCSKGENTLRGLAKRKPTACPRGHPYDEENFDLKHRRCKQCHRNDAKARRDAKRLLTNAGVEMDITVCDLV